jgi:hypothetical protein
MFGMVRGTCILHGDLIVLLGIVGTITALDDLLLDAHRDEVVGRDVLAFRGCCFAAGQAGRGQMLR